MRIPLHVNLFRYGAPARRHRHGGAEWGYLLCGKLIYHVGRRAVELGPHTLFQVAAGLTHHEVPLPGEAPQAIFIRPEMILKTDGVRPRGPLPVFASTQEPLVVFKLPPQNPVKDVLWEIWREQVSGHPNRRVWRALINLLAARLETLGNKGNGGSTPKPLALLKKANDLTDNRYRDPKFHVAALSRELGVSTRWLEKYLQGASGETPAALIRRHRLSAAKDLLRHGDHTISAVARLVGLSHGAHLIRCFRNAFGETPGQWQRREGQGAPPGPAV